MNETLDKIFEFLRATWKRQKYEYNVMQFDGSEENKQLKIANSIEYEFINSGNSLIILNDRLVLHPYWMGIEPVRVKFTMNKNEVDVSVWEYRFEEIKKGTMVWGYQYTAVTSINIPIAFDDTNAFKPFNKLQVIVKKISAM